MQTGESSGSVVKSITQFTQQKSFPWELTHITQLWDFIDSLPNGKKHNAAICALETALLDCIGKSQNISVMEFFPKDYYANAIYYSAIVPLTEKRRIAELCQLINKLNIVAARIKMGKV